MKRIFRSMMLLLTAAALTPACGEVAVQDITAPLPANSARVKFFNFGVGTPGVNFYADNMKMTAINSATGTESTVGVNYGAAGAGGLYLTLAPRQYTMSGRIAAAADKDHPVSNLPVTLADGKAYSYFLSGIYDAATKTVDSFIVEDPIIPNFDYSTAYVRFVHAVSNANPMALTLRERTEGTDVAAGATVAYRAAGQFVKVPPGQYDLTTRYDGATTNAMTRANVSFVAGRVYTITARGNINVASTLLLDNTANR
jgi:hypothetical protein